MSDTNKKIVKESKSILKELGYDVTTGHLYELFSKISGHKSWNVAKAKKEDFSKIFLTAPKTAVSLKTSIEERLREKIFRFKNSQFKIVDFWEDPENKDSLAYHCVQFGKVKDGEKHVEGVFHPYEIAGWVNFGFITSDTSSDLENLKQWLNETLETSRSAEGEKFVYADDLNSEMGNLYEGEKFIHKKPDTGKCCWCNGEQEEMKESFVLLDDENNEVSDRYCSTYCIEAQREFNDQTSN